MKILSDFKEKPKNFSICVVVAQRNITFGNFSLGSFVI